MLCKYKNILGKPGKGMHFHVLGIAIVDLLLTIGVAVLLWRWKKWNPFIVFAVLMLIAILLHRLFCVNTTINKLIFGKVN
jgi:hypothetical protein